MDITAPTPLPSLPTAAIGCLGDFFPSDLFREVAASGFAPVFCHRLAGELGGSSDGPGEMLAATTRALEKTGVSVAWGAGCSVGTTDEAVIFATAGFTWFTFDLAGLVDDRADTMSMDQLDAAIVALEDDGCFPARWHEGYLDREWRTGAGTAVCMDDEVLARVAVKFGRALAHAGQLQQAVRTAWVGRGEPPDIELDLAARRTPVGPGEFLFLALEAARRGFNPAVITPSLGPAWQAGAEFPGGIGAALGGRVPEIARLCPGSKVGVHFAAGKGEVFAAARGLLGDRVHLNFEDATWLLKLGRMADAQPDAFRAWVRAAQEVFAFAVGDIPLAITEEDTRALPQVADSELRNAYLGHLQGRQLLIATFASVLRRQGLRAF